MNESWEGLSPPLLPLVHKGVAGFGFSKMTPVQAACIPRMLSHQDVAAEAVTGSGKTLAFLVPTLQIILRREDPLRKHDIYALIVSPTRELATQIHEVMQVLLKPSPQITTLLLVGGSSIAEDLVRFQKNGGHIVIGTPGRIEDVFARTGKSGISMAVGSKNLEILILDEADRLLELGFSETINTILAYLPKQRRTGLFSATQTSDVINLIRAGLRNPVQIKVRQNNENREISERTPVTLNNYFMLCDIDKKFSILVSLVRERKEQKILIFFASCASVDYFYEVLKELFKKANILAIHGKMKNKRFKVFDEFRTFKAGILACTDVMCRGVDIPQVDWVIQFDPPSHAESFVHRCGRTARSGLTGSAILMLLPQESEYVKFIELNQNVKLKRMEPPTDLPVLLDRVRKLQLRDRAIMDKATRAFVSFVQFYLKHECSVLFKLKNLNLGLLAMAYGLLKLPKMPELKNTSTDSFVPLEFDFNKIRYKDKQKEKSRLNKLAMFKQTGKWPGKKEQKSHGTVPWSKIKEAKEKKKEKKQKRTINAMEEKISLEDLQSLVDDEKMLNKFKKRKITSDDFDKYFGCSLNENETTST